MGIRDKLKIYEKRSGDEKRREPSGALNALGGEKIVIDGKEIWRFVHPYPLSRLRTSPGGDEFAGPIAPFLKYNRLPLDLSIHNLIFLDLETTALSTGAGSYAFLFGAGRLAKDEFVVEQYFMHDYSAEEPILHCILPYFRNAQAVVTYNGKTFDMPLLKNRYRMNRVPGFPVDIPVIDLIYPCRRLFKNVYENCALKTIEESLLGIRREDDIPGWLIPEVFFSFQKYGETDRLAVVLEHNSLDIKALFVLLYALNGIYRDVEKDAMDTLDRNVAINLAHHLYAFDIGIFIDMVMSLGPDALRERLLFKKFSSALKRSGRLQEAVDFWKGDGSIYSLEELAKHYEHREKDFSRAFDFCARAAELIDEGKFAPRGETLPAERLQFHRGRFSHRMGRLIRKKTQNR